MKIKATTVYFSATYTTKKIVEYVANQLSDDITTYDITNDNSLDEVSIPKEELLIVGIPVYAGRVPAMAIDRIRRFKGEGTRAIAIAVYGNRDYDDALLELSDILSDNGFQVISAGAFIAQHSIFPKVGANRPDDADFEQLKGFAMETKKMLETDIKEWLPITIKGNRPYNRDGGGFTGAQARQGYQNRDDAVEKISTKVTLIPGIHKVIPLGSLRQCKGLC